MIGTNFEGLITTHDKSNFFAFRVLQETNITSSTFLPLISSLFKAEKFSTTEQLKGIKINS